MDNDAIENDPKLDRVSESRREPNMYRAATTKHSITSRMNIKTFRMACTLETADFSIPSNVGKYFIRR